MILLNQKHPKMSPCRGRIWCYIRSNNQLESLKYLRLDGENQMVSNLQMNDHKLVGLADAVMPTDGVNKKVLDETNESRELKRPLL